MIFKDFYGILILSYILSESLPFENSYDKTNYYVRRRKKFCPECGSNNPEGLTNCSCCGALLEDNQPTRKNWSDYLSSLKNFIKEKALPFIKRRKKLIIPVVGLAVLAIVFLKIGSSVSSPDRIVDRYVKSLISSK